MKIIILRGLPGSGKSTWAEQFLKVNRDYIRVNKDSIRKMLHFGVFTPKNEGVTQAIQMAIVRAAIANRRNVIIDDTNIPQASIDRWMAVAGESGSAVEIKQFDTSIEECIERDSKREGSAKVGPDVIWKFAREMGYRNGKRDIICDIDGTLCDITERRHFVASNKDKDWKSFFENIPNDKPRIDVIAKVVELSKTHNIVLVSGRPEDYKKETIDWLKKYGVPYQCLLMRRTGDSRDDTIIKKEILDRCFDVNNIDLVIDDRPKVVRMWREVGLKVDDVGDQVEF